mgnify:CR=1 FL=1
MNGYLISWSTIKHMIATFRWFITLIMLVIDEYDHITDQEKHGLMVMLNSMVLESDTLGRWVEFRMDGNIKEASDFIGGKIEHE